MKLLKYFLGIQQKHLSNKTGFPADLGQQLVKIKNTKQTFCYLAFILKDGGLIIVGYVVNVEMFTGNSSEFKRPKGKCWKIPTL